MNALVEDVCDWGDGVLVRVRRSAGLDELACMPVRRVKGLEESDLVYIWRIGTRRIGLEQRWWSKE